MSEMFEDAQGNWHDRIADEDDVFCGHDHEDWPCSAAPTATLSGRRSE